ncbi:hypothetical protein FC83_GL002233 [Agrilactobacillus composti DSM 18527 = JCM 14202]|uniref:UPF0291 protein FC83_GL002233 n=1 Tax=Agrilactobacillus composti DSM 18527 = JCM 14202 TaxID=1423734 RepID=X0PGP7_9LACO|nr:DUF896 domain-containing protein [Agrilactobacillus composti]KRM36829.1 hypothetical protein FC83_GL002233 [Agrilactobacillus composti DSM 18527 = JCM 14202]GAF41229.1 hypothetical protein JCM14202_3158 [Agrilactobacillus composti DSM 18527 = JCM 14202]
MSEKKDLESQERIKRINELARKKKEQGLTEAEKLEQDKLRQAYLADFKNGFRSQIEMLRVFDKNGKEVTPKKVQNIQRKKGLRDD